MTMNSLPLPQLSLPKDKIKILLLEGVNDSAVPSRLLYDLGSEISDFNGLDTRSKIGAVTLNRRQTKPDDVSRTNRGFAAPAWFLSHSLLKGRRDRD